MEQDLALLDKYAKGRDAIAFTELTRRHREMVYSTALRTTGNHHDAEDVTQACFLELAARAGEITDSVAGWLHVQATNRAIDAIRRRDSRRRRERRSVEIGDEYRHENWRQIEPHLDQAIEKLPDDLRLPLILYFLEGFNQEQVGEILGLSQRTVSRRLEEAVKALRAHLGEIGPSLSLAVLVPLLRDNACRACPADLQASLVKIGLGGFGGSAKAASILPSAGSALVPWTALSIKAALAVMTVVALGLLSYQAITAPTTSCYDKLIEDYRPYIATGQPLGLPLKVDSLLRDPYALHTGGQDLLAHWLKRNVTSWFANPDTYVTCHGSLHPGNVGTYLLGPNADQHAFGLIDLDESIEMPVQVELLQGLASLEIISRRELADIDAHQLANAQRQFLQSFAASARADRRLRPDATQHLYVLGQLARRESYEKTLADYLAIDGRFKPLRFSTDSPMPTEILRPVDVNRRRLAEAIALALQRCPAFAEACRYRSAQQFHAAMRDVVTRVQLDSASSQGLTKLLILFRSPLVDTDRDAVFYLKRQIPTSFERAGLLETDPRTPAQRVADNAARLRPTGPGLISWCEFDGASFTLRLRQPWTHNLTPRVIVHPEQLSVAAELMGHAAGQAHRHDGCGEHVADVCTRLIDELPPLAEQYVTYLTDQYRRLARDSRAQADQLAVQSAVQSHATDPQPRTQGR